MGRYFWSTRAFCAMIAVVVAILVAGCGGGDDDSVNVETGSLSKAEFIRRADVICQNARTHFTKEYRLFVGSKVSNFSKANEKRFQQEAVDTVVIPNFEKDVDEISALGAPEKDKQAVAGFLIALQQRLDKLHEKPSELSNDVFDRPAKLARAYGLTGCANSLT
jgi:hypothetical protein